MPLHLLGKKSWNVYNPANIERVKRDEAEARRRAQEREERELQDEADERIRILQGKAADIDATRQKLAPDEEDGLDKRSVADGAHRHGRIQKRQLAGEDDTDRDIRIARETQSASASVVPPVTKSQRLREDSIVDARGNISLIPVPLQETDLKLRRKEDEDPYTVYLSHAVGKGKSKDTNKPWYSSASTGNVLTGRMDDEMDRSEDQWGDGSKRRKQRDAARIAADDPLAMMKKGVNQLREAEKRRKEWMEQRERDLREVEDLAARETKKRRKREVDEQSREKRRPAKRGRDGLHLHEDDDDIDERKRRRRDDLDNGRDEDEERDSLEGFKLDGGYSESRHDRDRDRDRDSERSHYRHRHRHRHSHHHRHRHREYDRGHGHGSEHDLKENRGQDRYTAIS